MVCSGAELQAPLWCAPFSACLAKTCTQTEMFLSSDLQHAAAPFLQASCPVKLAPQRSHSNLLRCLVPTLPDPTASVSIPGLSTSALFWLLA